jgi:hypothetical protein
MLRTYAPGYWVFGGIVLGIPAVGAAGALMLLAQGSWIGASVLLASVAMLQLRLQIRRRIAERVLPREAQSSARRTIAFSSWAWPMIHFVHCSAFLSSCFGRRFTWAGIRYQLDGRNVLINTTAGVQ